MNPPVAPPGWPAEVRPPDAPEWVRSATVWLLDQCPPEYRGHRAVREQPIVLARFTVHHVEASRDAVHRALSEARADLPKVVDASVVEGAVQAWLHEEARLQGLRRAVGLVEEALRGRRFAARL
ncbi:hypothetical protein [Nocardioides sp. AX2bis]|uniref:hypothetical protein n=1 Tax=Nocardioides sp. AX2bis TaxID=2653157 RepID=UPI001356A462|nr:hypothetical protein [Nocardioides sp. AX2bis]